MKTHLSLIAVMLASGMSATAVAAQDDIFGVNGAGTEFSDLQDAISDDVTDAEDRRIVFGNAGRNVGTYGSVALRATSSTSPDPLVDDVTTVGLGAQYGFFDGVNGSELNLSYAYSETNGVASKNTLNAGYDYTRDFSENFFGFANVNVKWDELAVGDNNARDAYIGVGVGYRLINTNSSQLAIKVGPGYRFIEQGDGDQVDEAAYSLEANYHQTLSDSVYLSDDLQLIGSNSDTTVTNELALNVAMSQTLSLRTSYLSKFQGVDIGSLSGVENTVGLSVVYNFN